MKEKVRCEACVKDVSISRTIKLIDISDSQETVLCVGCYCQPLALQVQGV